MKTAQKRIKNICSKGLHNEANKLPASASAQFHSASRISINNATTSSTARNWRRLLDIFRPSLDAAFAFWAFVRHCRCFDSPSCLHNWPTCFECHVAAIPRDRMGAPQSGAQRTRYCLSIPRYMQMNRFNLKYLVQLVCLYRGFLKFNYMAMQGGRYDKQVLYGVELR